MGYLKTDTYKGWQNWQGNEGEFTASSMKALVPHTIDLVTGAEIDPNNPPAGAEPKNYPTHLSIEVASINRAKVNAVVDEIESKGILTFLKNKKLPETTPKYDMNPEELNVYVRKCGEAKPCSDVDVTETPPYTPPQVAPVTPLTSTEKSSALRSITYMETNLGYLKPRTSRNTSIASMVSDVEQKVKAVKAAVTLDPPKKPFTTSRVGWVKRRTR